MEYSLQQQNDIDYTIGLEERVISLKARIREMKMKIGYIDHKGRKEPKLDIPKQTVNQNSNIDAIKAKLLGRG
tara:strand:- start:554 stop:772 length:219 start_codon:yes stop_codon:yes gene_type:complete